MINFLYHPLYNLIVSFKASMIKVRVIDATYLKDSDTFSKMVSKQLTSGSLCSLRMQ